MDKRKQSRVLRRNQQPSSAEPVINLNDYYPQKKVTGMFGVVERTLRNWRDDKKLIAVKWGRRVLFEKASTDAALERWQQLGFL